MNKPWYLTLDWFTLLIWITLVCCGLTAIYSATHGPASEYLLESVQQNFWRQLFWATLSLMGIIVILLIPTRFFQKTAFVVYAFTLLLLIAALLFGREVNGAKSWIRLGPISFQSAELAKLGTILAIAQLFGNLRDKFNVLQLTLLAVVLILVPAGLIVAQNDTGTALVFLALIPMTLFWSGIPLPTVTLLVAPALVGYLAVVSWPSAVVFSFLLAIGLYFGNEDRKQLWGSLGLATGLGTTGVVYFALKEVLLDHQVARIASFVNPEAYRLTSGFHIIQARAAIGSGGLTGKGFMQGTQTQMAFVPEQSTDFIYCVIGEEFGFLGAILILVLFGFLLMRLMTLGTQVRHPFASMFAAGAAGLFFVHILINIGMTIGVMPVIGIPLPFLSYGGSALLSNTLILAVVLNLAMRRGEFPRYAF